MMCAVVVLIAVVVAPDASGTQDQPVLAGQANDADSTTSIELPCPNDGSCFANGITALIGLNPNQPNNTDPVGVWGDAGLPPFYSYPSGGAGVFGTNSDGAGVVGMGLPNGVFGLTSNAGGSGVYGENDGTGYGVAGRTTSSGAGTGVFGDAPNSTSAVAVEADSAHGTALRAKGKVVFNRSGIATVAGTATTPLSSVVVTVPGSTLTAASMVLATIQGNLTGVSVQGVVKGTTSFTIHLTKPVTSNLKVGWFIIG
jgi:hypothetical protein